MSAAIIAGCAATAIQTMVEQQPDPSALRVCTISTRSGAGRARAIEASVGAPVEVFVLDGDGIERLAGLLGDDAERFAAGFDAEELTLLVLPRLLARMLDEGARTAAYVDARAELSGELTTTNGDAVLVDPWPSEDGPDPERIGSIVVSAHSGSQGLLSHWSELAAKVLDEDRVLSPRTTLLWLRALGASLPDVEIRPAGLVAAAPRKPPRDAHEPGPEPSESSDAAYGFASLPGGIALNSTLRRLLRRSPFERPFSALDPPKLLQWLAEPAAPPRAVPRYLAALSDQRADLRDTFGSPDGEADAALLAWAQAEGRGQDPVLALILPEAPAATAVSRLQLSDGRPGAFGVNVVGYWQAELGIADAARLLVAGLDAARVPVQPVTVGGAPPPSRHGATFAAVGPASAAFAINLLCINPDGLLAFHEQAAAGLFDRRANIGYWWWELLDAFPPAWRPAFDLVDEVWVGSRHVHEAIAPASPVPVRLVPIPVRPLPVRRSRSELGLPDGFLFLTMFDYNSAFERKNPLATVQAFRKAFAPGSGASLVVKSINGAKWPDHRDELAIFADGHPDVQLLDDYMDAADVDALLAGADCLVSLHRAEGFGIPLARALRSEIPVVATGYGGNLDFMTEQNSYLVGHQAATVPEGTIYPAGAAWVDPSVDDAAAQLRRVFEHPDEARARARLAAASLAEQYSPARTGARTALELRRIQLQSGRETGPAPHRQALDPAAVEELRRLLRAPLESLGGTGRGALLARRSLDRVTRPISDRQRAIDDRLLDDLLRLAEAGARHVEISQLENEYLIAPAAAVAELAGAIRRDREAVGAALAKLRAELRGNSRQD